MKLKPGQLLDAYNRAKKGQTEDKELKKELNKKLKTVLQRPAKRKGVSFLGMI